MDIQNNMLSPLNALSEKNDPDKGAALIGMKGKKLSEVIESVDNAIKPETVDFSGRGVDSDLFSEVVSVVNGGKKAHVSKGNTIRCNLQPISDSTWFEGKGKVLTTDIFGNEHTFDISKARNGSQYTAKQLVQQKIFLARAKNDNTPLTIGILGDSITDGADSTGWVANPTSGGNLSSTNYNHNNNGGANSWSRVFNDWLNVAVNTDGIRRFEVYNASSSGKQLWDRWAFDNFDYGFFQNAAYGNKAPDVLFIAMGTNDASPLTDIDTYAYRFEQLARKAWGYGCAVCVIDVNSSYISNVALTYAVKARLGQAYNMIDFIDLGKTLKNIISNQQISSIKDVFTDGSGTYDFTHPNDAGHKLLGAACAKEFLSEQIIFAKKGMIKSLYSTADSTVIEFPNKNILPASGHDTSNSGVFSGKDSIVEYQTTANGNAIVYANVWVDDNIDLVAKQWLKPNCTTGGRAHTVKVSVNDPIDTSYINTGGLHLNDESTVQSRYLGQLRHGLNRIEITYDGNPSVIYPPELCFNESLRNENTDKAVEHSANVIKSINAGAGFIYQADDPRQVKLTSYDRTKLDHVCDLSFATQYHADINIIANVLTQNSGFACLNKGADGIFIELTNAATGEIRVSTYSGSTLSTVSTNTIGVASNHYRFRLQTSLVSTFVYASVDSGTPALIATISRSSGLYAGGQAVAFATNSAAQHECVASYSVRLR